MPLFGISKNQAQAMIDAAIAHEAEQRALADSENAANIDAERNIRFASDKQLNDRIVYLESGTHPPDPTPPKPQINGFAVGALGTISDDLAAVGLTVTSYTPQDAHTAIVCSDPTATTNDGWNWTVTRAAVSFTVDFTLTVTDLIGQTATAKCTATIPEKPAPIPPDPIPHELLIPASSFKIGHSLTLQWDHDHWSNWGQPNESVVTRVHGDLPTKVKMWFDYVLAQESASADTVRDVAEITAEFDVTCELWSAPVRAWSDEPVEFDLEAGDNTITVEVPANSPAWSNWLDLYAVRLVSDSLLTVVPQ